MTKTNCTIKENRKYWRFQKVSFKKNNPNDKFWFSLIYYYPIILKFIDFLELANQEFLYDQLFQGLELLSPITSQNPWQKIRTPL